LTSITTSSSSSSTSTSTSTSPTRKGEKQALLDRVYLLRVFLMEYGRRRLPDPAAWLPSLVTTMTTTTEEIGELSPERLRVIRRGIPFLVLAYQLAQLEYLYKSREENGLLDAQTERVLRSVEVALAEEGIDWTGEIEKLASPVPVKRDDADKTSEDKSKIDPWDN
jgi:hypothetical protein